MREELVPRPQGTDKLGDPGREGRVPRMSGIQAGSGRILEEMAYD